MTAGDRLVLRRNRRSSDAAFCPYNSTEIDLGHNIFPRRWANVTCGPTPDPSLGRCGVTLPTPFPGVNPLNSFCQPIYYNVEVLNLTTTKFQTSKCVIETYATSWIRLVVGCRCEIHWGRGRMASSTPFSWMQLAFNLNFTGPIGSKADNGLALNRRQASIWTNNVIVYWCIYELLSLHKLKCNMYDFSIDH